MKTLAYAPSNIAWVKYMGKKPDLPNIPENPSLSMTLQNLCSLASLEEQSGPFALNWVPESPVETSADFPRLEVPSLDPDGKKRILSHVKRVLDRAPDLLKSEHLEFRPPKEALLLRTANTFPPSSGIASSASSFAAVTLCTLQMAAADADRFAAQWRTSSSLRRSAAALSREGSGSSCRSMEGPFVLWQAQDARSIPHRLPELHHFVLLVSAEKKAISSSQAHQRVKTSPLWEGRPARATHRCEFLKSAIGEGNLTSIAQISWEEAWEMHSLFHTSREPFTYWQPQTIEILHWLAPQILSATPPIVTLDAGPNIHITITETAASSWRERLKKEFPKLVVLEDKPGTGAQCLPLKQRPLQNGF